MVAAGVDPAVDGVGGAHVVRMDGRLSHPSITPNGSGAPSALVLRVQGEALHLAEPPRRPCAVKGQLSRGLASPREDARGYIPG